MKKISVFLSVLLLCLILSPVSAYTEYATWTPTDAYTGTMTTVPYPRVASKTLNHTITEGIGITKVSWTGICKPASGTTLSGTSNGFIQGYRGTAPAGYYTIGNATHNWQFSSDSSWGACSIDTEIQDLSFNYMTSDTVQIRFNGLNRTSWGTKDVEVYRSIQTPPSWSFPYLDEQNVGYYNGTHTWYTGASVVAPEASFTCSPVSQYPDEDVVCTDTSSNTPTNWLWTLDYDALGILGWQTSTSRNFTWQSHYPGLFSVNLWANNSAGGSWYNRSEYVEISQNASPMTPETPIPAGYIRSAAQCVDSQTSGTIRTCQISLLDKEGGVWSNGSWYGTYYIDTLPAHHIDAYGVATGYTSTSRLNLPASGTIMYELLMVPGYVPPAADGYVWLYVIINDLATGAPLPNAQVQVSSTGETTQSRTTGYNGQASFQVTNNSVWHVSASLSGYKSETEVVTTSSAGPDVVRIELYRTTVTTVPTGTVLPGELTPRPTQDPAGNPGTPGYSNAKGQEMLDWLAQNGMDLVQLCFMVTVLALLGVKLGK